MEEFKIVGGETAPHYGIHLRTGLISEPIVNPLCFIEVEMTAMDAQIA